VLHHSWGVHSEHVQEFNRLEAANVPKVFVTLPRNGAPQMRVFKNFGQQGGAVVVLGITGTNEEWARRPFIDLYENVLQSRLFAPKKAKYVKCSNLQVGLLIDSQIKNSLKFLSGLNQATSAAIVLKTIMRAISAVQSSTTGNFMVDFGAESMFIGDTFDLIVIGGQAVERTRTGRFSLPNFSNHIW
jgi:hypothetical protein